ncbi:hypothetical protein SLS62_010409 [Diatrype stigma]|uniref:DUF3140 domain-containing protein n=1 Tax=Diatrype stigma TaxID=117547 RepID=A0AAN9UA24_9PEZI
MSRTTNTNSSMSSTAIIVGALVFLATLATCLPMTPGQDKGAGQQRILNHNSAVEIGSDDSGMKGLSGTELTSIWPGGIVKMVKDKQTVIKEFNDLVNMSASDLEEWLKGESSESAGWGKSDGSGETIGHESGRKIIEILKKNPEKDPDAYDDGDVDHMRRVVAYCKRHLAQESAASQDPDSRSARSLKNWGHDPSR